MNEPSDSLSIIVKNYDVKRRPVAVFFQGWRTVDSVGRQLVLPYIPDPSLPENMAAAAIHRFGCRMPSQEPRRLEHFRAYARAFIRRFIVPLRDDEVPPFEGWLDKTSYSGRQKEMLRRVRDETETLTPEELVSKSFIKYEGYEEPKMPRGINSYTDAVKTYFGPLFHAIDKRLFASTPRSSPNQLADGTDDPDRWFIKGLNPKFWPRMMENVFGDEPVVGTDFSSFEAHHHGVFAEIITYWMAHCIRDLPMKQAEKRVFIRLVRGINITKFKNITAMIDERLMSGAMWTSSANGLLNLLIMTYLIISSKGVVDVEAMLNEVPRTRGKVEGDDGLFVCHRPIDTTIVAELGLKLKPTYAPHYSGAGFCSIICDPVSLVSMKDPAKVLRDFFAVPMKFSRKRVVGLSYLRAKAVSYAYSFKDCPIIGPLAKRVCDLTRSYDVRAVSTEMDAWMRDAVNEACANKAWLGIPNIDISSRELVERVFEITQTDQHRIESAIAQWDGTSDLRLDLDFMVNDTDIFHADNISPVDPDPVCMFTPEVIRDILNDGRLRGKSARDVTQRSKIRNEPVLRGE